MLLDAAFGGKRASKGRKKPIKLAAGTYDIDELYLNDDRGSHIVQLRPQGVSSSPARAARAASPKQKTKK